MQKIRNCDDIVTLWHRNITGNTETFTRTVMPVLCMWERNSARVMTDKGVVWVQNISVIVPFYEGFDCAVDDIMALGEHDVEITNKKPFTVTEVKQLLAPDVIIVKAVNDLTKGQFGKHWEIEGVS